MMMMHANATWALILIALSLGGTLLLFTRREAAASCKLLKAIAYLVIVGSLLLSVCTAIRTARMISCQMTGKSCPTSGMTMHGMGGMGNMMNMDMGTEEGEKACPYHEGEKGETPQTAPEAGHDHP